MKKATKSASDTNGATNRIAKELDDGSVRTHIVISAPNLRVATFAITGTAPYVGNKFSQKAKQTMRDQQTLGSQSKKGKGNREPKNFDECYEQAKHYSEQGWCGIPAPAFRAAMIDACRLVGFKMTFAKLSVFILGDGIDRDEGTPLVRIYGEPEKNEMAVRNATGVADIRARPMWRKWSAKLKVQFDMDQFSESDITNLLLRAGNQVGIGAGRPNSRDSFGQGWGTFTISES